MRLMEYTERKRVQMKHKINSCKNRVRKIINMCGIIVTVLVMNTTAFAENYEYDELNRVTKVIYDDGSYVTYVYDNNGNVIDIIVYEIETETETDKETTSNNEVNKEDEKNNKDDSNGKKENGAEDSNNDKKENAIDINNNEQSITDSGDKDNSNNVSDNEAGKDKDRIENETIQENDESDINEINKENNKDNIKKNNNNKNTPGNAKEDTMSVGTKVAIGAILVSAVALSGVFVLKKTGNIGIFAGNKTEKKDK